MGNVPNRQPAQRAENKIKPSMGLQREAGFICPLNKNTDWLSENGSGT